MTDWTREQLRVLRRVLAEMFPREADQRRMVRDVGLPTSLIDFSGVAENTFVDILEKARLRGDLDRVLHYALDSEEGRGNETLAQLRDGAALTLRDGRPVGTWHGRKRTVEQLEKIIGSRSTLVPVRYLARGLERAAAVARIECVDGAFGSGFLVDGDRLVTNHHVLPSREEALKAVARFDHEELRPGVMRAGEAVSLEPHRFFKTSADDDWTVVAVATGTCERWKPIPLTAGAVVANALVNIIQHPLGGPKMLSIEPRLVAFVGEGRLQYLTDTQPGSSGSPVFDLEWNLVGLHHSGGWIREPSDDSDKTWFRNEGILIERILGALGSV